MLNWLLTNFGNDVNFKFSNSQSNVPLVVYVSVLSFYPRYPHFWKKKQNCVRSFYNLTLKLQNRKLQGYWTHGKSLIKIYAFMHFSVFQFWNFSVFWFFNFPMFQFCDFSTFWFFSFSFLQFFGSSTVWFFSCLILQSIVWFFFIPKI